MSNNFSVFDKIKVGDLIFTRSEDLIGEFIRFITTSEINHVGIYIGDGRMIESQLNFGVRIINIQQYLDDKNTSIFVGHLINVNEQIRQKTLEEANNLLNRPYDLLGQIGILFKIIIIRLGLKKVVYFYGKNINHNKRGYWCSELVTHCFNKAGLELTEVDKRYATPEDLAVSKFVDFKNF